MTAMLPLETHRAVVARLSGTIKLQDAQIANLTANASSFSSEAAALRQRLAELPTKLKELPRLDWQAARYQDVCDVLGRPRGNDVVEDVKALRVWIAKVENARDDALVLAEARAREVEQRDIKIREYKATEKAIESLLKIGADEGEYAVTELLPIGSRVNLELMAEYRRGLQEMCDAMMEVVHFSISEAEAHGARVHREAYTLMEKRMREQAEEMGIEVKVIP